MDKLGDTLERIAQKYLGMSADDVVGDNSGSACSCLSGRDCYGENGWHFVRAGKNFCWTTDRIQSTGRPYLEITDSNLPRENTEGSHERISVCAGGCALRREVDDLVVEMEEPNCQYAGKVFAYERCPRYVAKMEGDFMIDPIDSIRIITRSDLRKRENEERL